MFNVYVCDKNISFQRGVSTAINDIVGKKHLDINITTKGYFLFYDKKVYGMRFYAGKEMSFRSFMLHL